MAQMPREISLCETGMFEYWVRAMDSSRVVGIRIQSWRLFHGFPNQVKKSPANTSQQCAVASCRDTHGCVSPGTLRTQPVGSDGNLGHLLSHHTFLQLLTSLLAATPSLNHNLAIWKVLSGK
jgi:hypothetical protein